MIEYHFKDYLRSFPTFAMPNGWVFYTCGKDKNFEIFSCWYVTPKSEPRNIIDNWFVSSHQNKYFLIEKSSGNRRIWIDENMNFVDFDKAYMQQHRQKTCLVELIGETTNLMLRTLFPDKSVLIANTQTKKYENILFDKYIKEVILSEDENTILITHSQSITIIDNQVV